MADNLKTEMPTKIEKNKKMTKIEGALDRARTDDLRLIRATRYQLRYESCCPDDNTVLKQVPIPEKPQSIYCSVLLAMKQRFLFATFMPLMEPTLLQYESCTSIHALNESTQHYTWMRRRSCPGQCMLSSITSCIQLFSCAQFIVEHCFVLAKASLSCSHHIKCT